MTKIIVSLETEEAFKLAEKLTDYVDGFKINHILWPRLKYRGFRKKEIFIDFKLWDTPHTITSILDRLLEQHVTMTTICTYNSDSVFEALIPYHDQIKLLGVTYLTSWSPDDQYNITSQMPDKMWETALRRIKGFYGVVCATTDIKDIDWHDYDGELKKVCPGIGSNTGQVRTSTPFHAKELGADWIVLGRTITEAENPITTIKEIKKGLND